MKVQALPIIVFCFFIFCAEKELKTDKMRTENEKRERLIDWITQMDEVGLDELIDEYLAD